VRMLGQPSRSVASRSAGSNDGPAGQPGLGCVRVPARLRSCPTASEGSREVRAGLSQNPFTLAISDRRVAKQNQFTAAKTARYT